MATSVIGQCGLGHRFGGNAEMLVKILIRRAGAEAGHADKGAGGADDRVPALANTGFDGDVDLGIADQRCALGLPARDTARSTAPRRRAPKCRRSASSFLRRDRDGDFRAGGEERHGGAVIVGGDQFVGAERAEVVLVKALAQLRHVLPRQREHARRVVALQRQLPALDGLDRVAGPEHLRSGMARSAARCSTG